MNPKTKTIFICSTCGKEFHLANDTLAARELAYKCCTNANIQLNLSRDELSLLIEATWLGLCKINDFKSNQDFSAEAARLEILSIGINDLINKLKYIQ
jgi:hypothetical protein